MAGISKTRVVIQLLAIIGMAYFAHLIRGDQVDNELKENEGVWKVVRAEQSGNRLPDEELKEMTVTFCGGVMTIKSGDNLDLCDVEIDPTTIPKGIDFRAHKLKKKQVDRGIYQLNGDELTLCWSGEKFPGGRTEEFKTTIGGGQRLLVLQRAKAPNQAHETDKTEIREERWAIGASFCGPIDILLSRPAEGEGRWFFVDLDHGALRQPPFAVELDHSRLPFTVLEPDEATLRAWLTKEEVDLILFAKPQAVNPSRSIERVQTWSIQTKLEGVNNFLQLPHAEGSEWQWKPSPESVIAPYVRRNDTVLNSGFVPNSDGGKDIKPDSPELKAFRTASNVVGFYLIEHNNLTKDSLRLRICRLAGVKVALADLRIDGEMVDGQAGASTPPE